jgi:hypothetical protein
MYLKVKYFEVYKHSNLHSAYNPFKYQKDGKIGKIASNASVMQ